MGSERIQHDFFTAMCRVRNHVAQQRRLISLILNTSFFNVFYRYFFFSSIVSNGPRVRAVFRYSTHLSTSRQNYRVARDFETDNEILAKLTWRYLTLSPLISFLCHRWKLKTLVRKIMATFRVDWSPLKNMIAKFYRQLYHAFVI